jgi:hypothetical protein
MTFGATVDTSRPHTVIEVHHPVDLWVPRRAHLAKGTYQFQGDLRPCFRDLSTRRLVAAGVVSVRYVAVDEAPQTVSARTEMVPASAVVSPKALDLKSQIPTDFAPTTVNTVNLGPVLQEPVIGTSAPEQAETMETPPEAIYTQPEPVPTETTPVATEPAVIATEPEPVVTEQAAVATEPEPVATETKPESTEIEPVTADAIAGAEPVRRRRRNQL